MKKLSLVAATFILLTIAGCGTKTEVPAKSKPTSAQPLALVYLGGFVQQSGMYNVPVGSTYGEVIKRAGGLRPEADAAKIDSSIIIDGTVQIYVPGINDANSPQSPKTASGSVRPESRASDAAVQGSSAQNMQAQVIRAIPAASLSYDEKELLDLINRERSSKGLTPLVADSRLVKAARMKSQDMVDNDYFAHESPKYGTASELVAKQGISYHIVGENIAIAGTVDQAHRGLMGSPGHRQNIMHPAFRRVGIGIVSGP